MGLDDVFHDSLKSWVESRRLRNSAGTSWREIHSNSEGSHWWPGCSWRRNTAVFPGERINGTQLTGSDEQRLIFAYLCAEIILLFAYFCLLEGWEKVTQFFPIWPFFMARDKSRTGKSWSYFCALSLDANGSYLVTSQAQPTTRNCAWSS